MNTHYTMKVYEIQQTKTSDEGHLILHLDGQLSAKAKRDIKDAIDCGRVEIRQTVRRLA